MRSPSVVFETTASAIPPLRLGVSNSIAYLHHCQYKSRANTSNFISRSAGAQSGILSLAEGCDQI